MKHFLSDIHKRLTIYSAIDIFDSCKKDWVANSCEKDWVARRSYFLFNDLKGKKVAYYVDQIIGTFCTLLSDIIMRILSIPYCIIRGLRSVIKEHEGKRCSKHNHRFTNDVVDNLFIYPVFHIISALVAVIMMPIFMICKIISTIVYPFTKQENLYVQPEIKDYKKLDDCFPDQLLKAQNYIIGAIVLMISAPIYGIALLIETGSTKLNSLLTNTKVEELDSEKRL